MVCDQIVSQELVVLSWYFYFCWQTFILMLWFVLVISFLMKFNFYIGNCEWTSRCITITFFFSLVKESSTDFRWSDNKWLFSGEYNNLTMLYHFFTLLPPVFIIRHFGHKSHKPIKVINSVDFIEFLKNITNVPMLPLLIIIDLLWVMWKHWSPRVIWTSINKKSQIFRVFNKGN